MLPGQQGKQKQQPGEGRGEGKRKVRVFELGGEEGDSYVFGEFKKKILRGSHSATAPPLNPPTSDYNLPFLEKLSRILSLPYHPKEL